MSSEASDSTEKLKKQNDMITRKLKNIDALDTVLANNLLEIDE